MDNARRVAGWSAIVAAALYLLQPVIVALNGLAGAEEQDFLLPSQVRSIWWSGAVQALLMIGIGCGVPGPRHRGRSDSAGADDVGLAAGRPHDGVAPGRPSGHPRRGGHDLRRRRFGPPWMPVRAAMSSRTRRPTRSSPRCGRPKWARACSARESRSPGRRNHSYGRSHWPSSGSPRATPRTGARRSR